MSPLGFLILLSSKLFPTELFLSKTPSQYISVPFFLPSLYPEINHSTNCTLVQLTLSLAWIVSRVPDLMSLLLLLPNTLHPQWSLVSIQPPEWPFFYIPSLVKGWVSLKVEAPVLTEAYRPYPIWFPVPIYSHPISTITLLIPPQPNQPLCFPKTYPHTPASKLLQVRFPLFERSSPRRCMNYPLTSFQSWA